MTTATWTPEAADRLNKYLESNDLSKGLGTEDYACSIAAINLALTGTLTAIVPDCMSGVIGRWIIILQDNIPDSIRNSREWKRLLSEAAGTGRDNEWERTSIIIDWMFETVLPSLQPVADDNHFGVLWQTMCEKKTKQDAHAALSVARRMAKNREAWLAVYAAGEAVTWSAEAAARSAKEAASALGNGIEVWQKYDPCGLLNKLVRADGNPTIR